MPRVTLPLQGFYVSESLPISNQDCINLRTSPPQTTTITEMALIGTEGLVEKTAAEDNEFNRGAHNLAGILYEINGNNLYQIDRSTDTFGVDTFEAVNVNASVTVPGNGRVLTTDNGTQMVLVVPDETQQFNAWIFTVSGGLVQISDSDFDGPVSTVVYVNGFFIFTKKDGNKFFSSDLRDGFTFIATDFADAEADPDPINAAFVLRNQLYILGSETFEPYAPIDGSGFSFQRVEGGVIQKGIDAPFAIIEMKGSMIWLGSSVNEQSAVWASNGGEPEKLSTTAIENQIRTFTDTQIENAFMNKYSQSGHYIFSLTFPGQTTFEYNFTSGLWNERKSLSGEAIIPWRVTTITGAYGELFVGDSISNKIGILDKDTFTEYGSTIKRQFTPPPIDNNGNPFFTNSVEAFLETGNALTAGQGSDPEMLMSISDNGGRTFNFRLSRKIGKIGNYLKRVVWNRLGISNRERMFTFEMTDPIKWVIIKVEADIDG